MIILILSIVSVNATAQPSSLKGKKKKGGSATDEGITSPTHEKYLSQFTFSNQTITREHTDDVFKAEFGASEQIYMRVFLPHSVRNQPQKDCLGKHGNNRVKKARPCIDDCKYVIRLFINDEFQYNVDCGRLNDEQSNYTSMQFALSTNTDGTANGEWEDLVRNLSEGSYTVKVDFLTGDCGWNSEYSHVNSDPFATGSFTLNKTAGETIVIGRVFEELETGQKDAEMEAKILDAIRYTAGQNGWKEDFQKIKIITRAGDWNIYRQEYTGLVLRRSVWAYAYAQWPDGHCTVQSFEFSQESQGGGVFSEGFETLDLGDRFKVDCTD